MIGLDHVDREFAERIVSGQRAVVDAADDLFDTLCTRFEDADGQVVHDDALAAIEELLDVAQRQFVIQVGLSSRNSRN